MDKNSSESSSTFSAAFLGSDAGPSANALSCLMGKETPVHTEEFDHVEASPGSKQLGHAEIVIKKELPAIISPIYQYISHTHSPPFTMMCTSPIVLAHPRPCYMCKTMYRKLHPFYATVSERRVYSLLLFHGRCITALFFTTHLSFVLNVQSSTTPSACKLRTSLAALPL